jgi:hypothetical protein
MDRLLAHVSLRQCALAVLDQRSLPRGKTAVERSQEFQESLRKVVLWIKAGRRAVHWKTRQGSAT